jgi:flagellar hook-basal body complex protein FliE
MSIEAISALGASTQLLQSSAPAASAGVSFASTLDQIATLNSRLVENEGAVRSLALGETDNLHEVMMGLESARLQLDLLLQVRNKLLDAYQEMMRMQV